MWPRWGCFRCRRCHHRRSRAGCVAPAAPVHHRSSTGVSWCRGLRLRPGGLPAHLYEPQLLHLRDLRCRSRWHGPRHSLHHGHHQHRRRCHHERLQAGPPPPHASGALWLSGPRPTPCPVAQELTAQARMVVMLARESARAWRWPTPVGRRHLLQQRRDGRACARVGLVLPQSACPRVRRPLTGVAGHARPCRHGLQGAHPPRAAPTALWMPVSGECSLHRDGAHRLESYVMQLAWQA